MGLNRKQADSNLATVDYTTGRCGVECEQCYVNFGQIGCATIGGMLLPSLAEHNAAWIAYAKAQGWRNKKRAPRFDQRAAYDIPKSPDRLLTGRKRPLKLGRGRATLPFFLRVSTKSDSSRAPVAWCEQVLKTWGDYCFFNTSVTSALVHPGHFDRVYHKVVVTVNGGYQKPPPIPQFDEDSAIDVEEHILGSMGERAPGDFLSPIAMPDREEQIKFYRLRALPTIAARFETDAPVVVTQMRFRSLAHVLEFARKYDCGVEVTCSSEAADHLKACSVFAPHLRHLSLDVQEPSEERPVPTVIRLTYKGRDNASEHRGEPTVLRHEAGYFKAAGEDYAHYDYVCDLHHLSCVGCGLCASLDGTQEGWTNALNVLTLKSGKLAGSMLLLGPEMHRTRYLYDYVPIEQTNHYFRLLATLRGARRNPDPIAEVVSYAVDPEVYDSWNTHEDVLALAGYCAFEILREGKRQGLSREEAVARVPYLVAVSLDDLGSIWDGTSPWNETFGRL